MKKSLIVLSVLFLSVLNAQEIKQVPQISVSGEGKVKVAPDQALIIATVETKGTEAKEVKKQNDIQVEAVLKLIKKMNLSAADFKTQRVALNPQYDYAKKKHNYNATQTIEIILRDLSKYDELMEGLVEKGINRIDNVSFQSSKMAQYESEARKLAIQEAKLKAEDYVSVVGQKVGRAITITDNSQGYTPQPLYMRIKTAAMSDSESAPRETLAAGEIEITANVNVSFLLN
ncbi:SIMPL domain-containing protein [Flavobacterium algicola]|uniref:SIMPL domain-containing protein n=1 Tax=Flavobacterium algicola TaxID=556529 RepID=UPI001EFEB57D|nr:SIMPL domain-containing protein [Flavobacterium algicola]MCG9790850.1 SIMPL domain-containing protein [Flavobacterium algicola]